MNFDPVDLINSLMINAVKVGKVISGKRREWAVKLNLSLKIAWTI